MVGTPQPLAKEFAIINPDGTPTDYFIRWAQERQIDISSGITAADAQALIDAWSATRDINAGTGLTGGGNLSADVTLALSASLDNLTDVDVTTTPPTDGQALAYDSGSGLWVPETVSGGGGNQPVSLLTMDALSGFTQANISGTRSVAEVAGKAISIIESSPSGGAKVAGIYKAVPSTPYRVAVFIQSNNNSRRYMGWAAGWTDGTKLHVVTDPASGAVEMMEFNTVSSRSSTSSLAGSKSSGFRATGFWLGLRDDGTNVFFEVSEDGVYFSPYFTVAKSSGWLGSSGYTNVFVGIYSEASDVSGTSYPHSTTIRTWDPNGLSRGF